MMKISTEFKIGIIGLITVAVVIWGINYLNGKNILKDFDIYYTYYDDANGIDISSKIYMQGYKVGLVKAVNYKQFTSKPIEVVLSIKSNYKVPKGSIAEMFSSNILGAQAINIIPSDAMTFCADYDTIATCVRDDMMKSLEKNLTPILSSLSGLTETLDSLSIKVNEIAHSGKIDRIINNTESVTKNLNAQLSPGGDFTKTIGYLENISREISQQTGSINNSIQHLESITGAIDPASVDSIVSSLQSLTPKIDLLLSAVNNGDGTVGQLVNNDSLYNQLESVTLSLNRLLDDVREHPKKYVHFSVFSGKEK